MMQPRCGWSSKAAFRLNGEAPPNGVGEANVPQTRARRSGSTKPSFIGIGAQKCASTWVSDILRDHPQVGLSERKELDFFSYHFERGFQWYERQFERVKGAVAVGEISPSYFHEPAVPARVRAYQPEARVIVSLRDPVERAMSHHRHAVRVGDVIGEDLSFESALPSNPTYLDQGRYATHLSRWLEHFPEEQVLVLFFDDVVHAPEATAGKIYRFLGLDDSHRSESLDKKSNVSHVTPFAGLEKARKALRGSARSVGLGRAWERAAGLGARRLYHRVNRRPSSEAIPPVSAATLQDLRAFFRDEMHRLEQITGRKTSDWR